MRRMTEIYAAFIIGVLAAAAVAYYWYVDQMSKGTESGGGE